MLSRGRRRAGTEAARLPAARAGVPTGFLLAGLLGAGKLAAAGLVLRTADTAAFLASGFMQAAQAQTALTPVAVSHDLPVSVLCRCCKLITSLCRAS